MKRQLSDRYAVEFTDYFFNDFLEKNVYILKIILNDNADISKDNIPLSKKLRIAVDLDYGVPKRSAAINLSQGNLYKGGLGLAYIMVDRDSSNISEIREKVESDERLKGLCVLPVWDVKDEMKKYREFYDCLAQLVMGYADNNYTYKNGNEDGAVWNNVLGCNLILRKGAKWMRKWTDTTQHYKNGEKTWNGRIFKGCDVMVVPSISIQNGGIINVNAMTFISPDAEQMKAARKNKVPLGLPYRITDFGRLVTANVNKGKGKKWYNQGEKSVKSTIKFMSYSSFSNFNDSRIGILRDFLQFINLNVGDGQEEKALIRLKPWKYDSEKEQLIEPAESVDKLLERCVSRLKDRLYLTVLDSAEDEQEMGEARKIVEEGLSMFGLAFSKHKPSEACEILLCYDKCHYKNGKIKDRKLSYLGRHPNAVTQEISFDTIKYLKEINKKSYSKALESVIKMVIVCLAIKDDIKRRGRMDIASKELCSLPVENDVHFAIRTHLNKDDAYSIMSIRPTGEISFKRFFAKDPVTNSDCLKIVRAYEPYKTGHPDPSITVLAWKDINDIYIFRSTGEHTMTDIEALYQALMSTNKKISISDFWQYFDEFEDELVSSRPDVEEKVSSYRKEIQERFDKKKMQFGGKYEYKKFQTAISGPVGKRRPLYEDFSKFLEEKKHILLDPHIRKKENVERFGLGNIKNVHVFPTPDYYGDGGNKGHSITYFAGVTKSYNLMNGIPNGILYKTVENSPNKPFDESFIKDLLKMCTAQFVKLGNNTVLPFPVKYLREYEQMKELEDECNNSK